MNNNEYELFMENNSKKTILFDMDGTLADNSKRQHYLRRLSKDKDWKSFKAEAYEDGVFEDVIWMARVLKQAGCRLIICTARTEDEREVTEKWLKEVAKCDGLFEKMYMRPEKDYCDDAEIKMQLLEQIRADGYDPYAVFDDRDRVVKAWRNAGIRCYQVNYGDF